MAPRNNNRKKNKTTMNTVGAVVGRLRSQAGLSQPELAERACVAPETIASIEQGRRPLLPHMAERLDDVLESKGVLWVMVDNLPEEAKFPVWVVEFVIHERDALTHYSYENQVLPGLLQTEGYARAVFRSNLPVLDEEEIEARVAHRLQRQAVLRRKKDPLNASFVIWEPVVRDALGGEEVRRTQLLHLRACADLPGVSIQILPLGRKTHAALNGPFVLLETPEHQLLAYTEVQRGGHLIHDPNEVSILSQKYAMLRSEALNPEESKRLLDQLLGES
ncbi:helix-turn-helix domain-containing protein [Streptomyces harbinensis]|uniref:helix-turn-helix domain-containing protein n=1 Tax=Streptomyces harbinensis TaxID=1176198 RepID=UPI001FE48194|nr:helix-turn-helix transcriptional regulator [Streptomyces harbinensis]